jgi:hypothetical protein
MQCFLAGLTYNIRRIVRHHQYFDTIELLHQARATELTLAKDAKFGPRSTARKGHFPHGHTLVCLPLVVLQDSVVMLPPNLIRLFPMPREHHNLLVVLVSPILQQEIGI